MKAFRILLLTTLLINTLSALAQSKYRSSLQDYYLSKSIGENRFLKRFCISGGKQFIPGTATLNFSGFVDSAITKKQLKENIKARQSYAFSIGVYFPITIISDNSMLVLNLDLMAAYSKLGYDSLTIVSTKKILLTTESYRGGMPISIEYHSGADVLLNKNIKSMFTIGAGIAPSYINSDDYNVQSPIIFPLFLKAEVGFFAGLGFKARFVYYFSNIHYKYAEDYDLLGGKNYMTSDFTGGAGYNISLIIMPFSYMWDR